MPKTRKQKRKGGSAAKSDPLRFKFKLGGRKSSTSALHLTDAELLKKFFSPSKSKDKQKIQQVLHMRGVEIVEPVAENEDK
jgi:hypothetical protein